jgi:hypothetical protein
LACCTEDVELHTPLEAVAGTYEGRLGIQRYLTDIEDAGPDFHIDLRDLEGIGDDTKTRPSAPTPSTRPASLRSTSSPKKSSGA